MPTTSDLKTGMVIRFNGVPHRVVEFQHVSPGNWRAFVRMKLKNMETGRVLEDRVRAGSEIEQVWVERRPVQYLYHDAETYYFMDTETFEQIEVPADDIGAPAAFLKEGTTVDILFADNKIMGVELPGTVTLEVIDAAMAVRGDTATDVRKQVTLETGAVIQAPAFVNKGDRVKVDTRTGEYLERAK